jgi:hypothetical protein
MDIRPALEQEADRLCELAMSAKARWGYPEETLEGWRAELSISANDIRTKPTYVAADAGRIVGFYSVPGITRRSSSIPTATTSRPCSMVRPRALRRRL